MADIMLLVETYADLITTLQEGRSEAVVYDAPPLMHEAKVDSDIKVVGEVFAHQQYGVVFPGNGREDLKELFNIEILKSRQNGDYQKIYAKWF